MLRPLINRVRSLRGELKLSKDAKEERATDRRGLPRSDPGIDPVVRESLSWLARAQDCSASHDGGVARDYSLIRGWATSYPETTGYIIPTLIECGTLFHDECLKQRARQMLDWLTRIQLPGGGFQGGRIDSTPVVPVIFNTGQILLGLAAGTKEFGTYRESMRHAADWLVQAQDPDGCWRKNATPFAEPGEKAYETHVAWGLFEAARLEPAAPYAATAMANIRWALGNQRANGWFEKCCLWDPSQPLTHTLGYALRGILEAYRFSKEPDLLAAAMRTADGLLGGLRGDGYLPGRFWSDWRPAVDFACLTGSVQIAYCWLMLYRYTGDARYRDAAFKANQFVRRTVSIDGRDEVRGGVKGSFPIDGYYGRYEYLNWAAKFLIDAQLLEREIRTEAA